VSRLIAIVLALVLVASSASAQVLPVPRRSSVPAMWFSLSTGFMQMDRVIDGSTGTDWRFGNALQWRGSVEVDVGRGGGLGLAVGLADVPLTYDPYAPTEPLPATCTAACDAHAKVWSVMATFHMGGGAGFHQVIDVGLGATLYRDFESDGGEALPPAGGDTDIGFSFGYGFGYGISSRTQLMIVQDASYVVHQREGLSGGDDTSSQQFVTRIGVRIGLGAR
jgi:hypothetical protein